MNSVSPPQKQPLFSGLQWLILCTIVLLGALYALASNNTKREQEQRAKDASAVLSEIADGKISNAFAFQQHCGQAAHMTRLGKDMVISYPDAGVSVSFMRLHPTDPTDLTFSINFWQLAKTSTIDPKAAVEALQCKA